MTVTAYDKAYATSEPTHGNSTLISRFPGLFGLRPPAKTRQVHGRPRNHITRLWTARRECGIEESKVQYPELDIELILQVSSWVASEGAMKEPPNQRLKPKARENVPHALICVRDMHVWRVCRPQQLASFGFSRCLPTCISFHAAAAPVSVRGGGDAVGRSTSNPSFPQIMPRWPGEGKGGRGQHIVALPRRYSGWIAHT
ncbi:uncharacterized protein LY79DRAFT_13095 [Colletotrichum navitas]|uniref:Uncharacterized protein n=1 Tax=Colletotrichum navitas TaxID=681940 RepID=A0AAD8QCT4_9PEZI|nr:uncharacterized protein LY79DRAFT_13095 [Colletotrichum navitas]KAK1600277.1 hypothetical protein LY79DRAFT_13095 [Colletotrichum navitas]